MTTITTETDIKDTDVPDPYAEVCWYTDESIDPEYYAWKDPKQDEESPEYDPDFDPSVYPEDERICCGEPVAICPECGFASDYCLTHNANLDKCEACGGDITPEVNDEDRAARIRLGRESNR